MKGDVYRWKPEEYKSLVVYMFENSVLQPKDSGKRRAGESHTEGFVLGTEVVFSKASGKALSINLDAVHERKDCVLLTEEPRDTELPIVGTVEDGKVKITEESATTPLAVEGIDQ
jgi:hypothetical protein